MTQTPETTLAEPGQTWATGQRINRVASPLRDQVIELVRNAILGFELQPDQRLVERELVERLGVSRATVREVISRLSAEGLVTVIPQKGAIVSIVSPDEAVDIYEMRAALEALAVRRFVGRATPAQLKRLRDALIGYERASNLIGSKKGKGRRAAVAPSDTDAALQAKDTFYDILLEGANSPPISQVLTSLQDRVRILRANSLAVEGRAVEAARELRKVVEAIESGDAEEAAAACAQHVRNAARASVGRLASIES